MYFEIITGNKTSHYQQADYLRFVKEYHRLTFDNLKLTKDGKAYIDQPYEKDKVEIFREGIKVHLVPLPLKCPHCKGVGITDDRSQLPAIVRCPHCKGTGEIKPKGDG